MASIRGIKNEIDYLVSEVISDGYIGDRRGRCDA